jgi:ribosomal protein S14
MALSTYKRYCLFNYAGKVVSRRFKLGRHAVRLFGGQGYLSGLRKSSF